MNILVTGSAGMIGGYVVKGLIEKGHTVIGVDMRKSQWENPQFQQSVLDLSSKEDIDIRQLFEDNQIDRAIHLAALAHTKGVADTSWEAFKKVNVDCAENVFEACAKHNVPVLFVSTVDAIGMVKGQITPETELNPISNYGKSKAMAEGRLKEICSQWNIYRFSPVYTEDVKRDIQKRYYLKYPDWAYLIGGGQQFEVLNVRKAVQTMTPSISSRMMCCWTVLPSLLRRRRKAGRSMCCACRAGWWYAGITASNCCLGRVIRRIWYSRHCGRSEQVNNQKTRFV